MPPKNSKRGRKPKISKEQSENAPINMHDIDILVKPENKRTLGNIDLNQPEKKLRSSDKPEINFKLSPNSSEITNDSDSSILELPLLDSNFNLIKTEKKKKNPTFKHVEPEKTQSSQCKSNNINLSQIENDDIKFAPKRKRKALQFSSDESSNDDKENINNDDSSIIIVSDDEVIEPKKGKKRIEFKSSDSENEENTVNITKKYNLRKAKKLKQDQENADDDMYEDDGDKIIDMCIESNEYETRHKLREILSEEDLNIETRRALREENERIKRLQEKKIANTEIDREKIEVYLAEDPVTHEKKLKIDDSIAKHLKPHQIEGIVFMWDSCFESIPRVQKNLEGNGCLLAHCMGLGKTLQVIAFIHTLLANRELTKCDKVLILLPVNVMVNWQDEISKWTRECDFSISVYKLTDDNTVLAKEKSKQRLNTIESWFNNSGVLLMGYQMFTNLVKGKFVKNTKQIEKLQEYLVKIGPDLIICDEGHVLKNDSTNLAMCVNQIKTRRRIVLTGTPLQNNLVEYHCMVSFVKPNLLGTLKEFKNMFVNPIYNGQHKDSSDADVNIMKQRAYVLHNKLEGVVNRKDFSIIRSFLPPKNEYVISIRLCSKQIDLYRTYLAKIRRIEDAAASNLGKIRGAILFYDYHMLYRIWTHPWLLKIAEIEAEHRQNKIDDKNFINDSDEEESESDEVAGTSKKKHSKKKEKKAINLEDYYNQDELGLESKDTKWYEDLVTDDCEYDMSLSGKLILFEQILTMCQEEEDKLVVFSQSLKSLDMIEKYLETRSSHRRGLWIKNKNYFRIDGSVNVNDRQEYIDSFNDNDNTDCRLFLLSTKAGGVGINLIGANRCIVFDSTWNPCYDTQSIYRIYRLGQQKEVFIYRFLAQGTMEEKIYIRQVTKNGLSQRVIDEHQLDRHYTQEELRELYSFYPDIYDGNNESYAMPKDELLKKLLMKNKKLIVRYHEHDSLLENKVQEGLSDAERNAAWKQYEEETQTKININKMIEGLANPSEVDPKIEKENNCVIS